MNKIILILIAASCTLACGKEDLQVFCETDTICDIQLYPNPIDSIVNLSFLSNLQDSAGIKIFSLSGEQLVKKLIAVNRGENELVLDLSDQENGSCIFTMTQYTHPDTLLVGRLLKK